MADNFITREKGAGLINVEIAREIIKDVAQSSACLQLMRRLPNMSSKQLKMPILSQMPTASFVTGDTGLKPVTSMDWKDKFIEAEEVAVVVPIPEAVINDSDYDIWAEIRPSVVEAMFKVIDEAILFGTGKPTSWPDGLVTGALSKDKKVALSKSVDLAEGVNQAMGLVENQGQFVNGFAGSIKLRSQLRGLRDKNNGFLYQPSMQSGTPNTLYGENIFYVTNGSWDDSKALLLAGDWTKAVYSIREDIEFKLLDQAVITDDSGKVVLNLAQQDAVAMRFKLRLGWQLANPMTALNSKDTKAYPFAAVVPQASAGVDH